MIVFLDTEFTGLSHPANDRKLLSLALVAENGSAEWYAELDGWVLTDCDPWVQRHVVPLLTGPSLSYDAATASLQDWFAERPRRVQAACDSDIDWRFLLGLLGDRPSNLAAQRHDLAPLIDTASYHQTVTAYFAKGHPEHHALHDARAYRQGWLAWMDTRKGGLHRSMKNVADIEPSDATRSVTELKGMFGKPKKTVSIEEMNSAIAAAAARAGR